MAGTPTGSQEDRVKRGAARPHFFRRGLMLFAVIAFVLIAVVAVTAFVVLRAFNERTFEEGAKALDRGDYRAAYQKLKEADGRGGTAIRNSTQSFVYFANLARAAWGSGDRKQARRYAEQGLERIPPDDSDAYTRAQPEIGTLVEIRDGIYVDPQDGLQPSGNQGKRTGDAPR